MRRRRASELMRHERLKRMIASAPHRICVIVYPGASIYDIAAVTETFATANMHLRREGLASEDLYSVDIVSSTPGPLELEMGLKILPGSTIAQAPRDIGTLIIAGGPIDAALTDRALIAWLERAADKSERVASMCTGAFLLAKAGLVKKYVTTHWAHCDRLRAMFPHLEVQADNIFIREDNVYSSAGSTAAMDLALALVEEDLGSATAMNVARRLVMFLKRPGGQSQFSTALLAQTTQSDSFRDLAEWISGNVGKDLSVEKLAARMSMSPRNFARVFLEETGLTPAKFVERARLERARQLIESSGAQITSLCKQAGFESPQKMRRAFVRWLGVTPADFAKRFGHTRSVHAVFRNGRELTRVRDLTLPHLP